MVEYVNESGDCLFELLKKNLSIWAEDIPWDYQDDNEHAHADSRLPSAGQEHGYLTGAVGPRRGRSFWAIATST
jgi:hypothetical protein